MSTHIAVRPLLRAVFFFNDTATTEIYTLSLHDALPILRNRPAIIWGVSILVTLRCRNKGRSDVAVRFGVALTRRDRKSTRLNSSHANISYAVFCLKKKQDTTRGRAQAPTLRSRYTRRPW